MKNESESVWLKLVGELKESSHFNPAGKYVADDEDKDLLDKKLAEISEENPTLAEYVKKLRSCLKDL